MQIGHAVTTTQGFGATSADRLDELGRIELVRMDYRPVPRPNPSPPLAKVARAMPTWDRATIDRANELGWDGFWAERPAGAGRLVRLDAQRWDDAVRAARELALTTRPGFAPGDKQAQAVLHLADGSWWAAGLGGIDEARQGMWLMRMGTYAGYWTNPTGTALVPEVVAIVGGSPTTYDTRGSVGTPVKPMLE